MTLPTASYHPQESRASSGLLFVMTWSCGFPTCGMGTERRLMSVFGQIQLQWSWTGCSSPQTCPLRVLTADRVAQYYKSLSPRINQPMFSQNIQKNNTMLIREQNGKNRLVFTWIAEYCWTLFRYGTVAMDFTKTRLYSTVLTNTGMVQLLTTVHSMENDSWGAQRRQRHCRSPCRRSRVGWQAHDITHVANRKKSALQ